MLAISLFINDQHTSPMGTGLPEHPREGEEVVV